MNSYPANGYDLTLLKESRFRVTTKKLVNFIGIPAQIMKTIKLFLDSTLNAVQSIS